MLDKSVLIKFEIRVTDSDDEGATKRETIQRLDKAIKAAKKDKGLSK